MHKAGHKDLTVIRVFLFALALCLHGGQGPPSVTQGLSGAMLGPLPTALHGHMFSKTQWAYQWSLQGQCGQAHADVVV